jgi:site-specific DNA recombinase
LEQAVTGYEHKQQSVEKFIALIDKYENFDTLTTTMLNEFVEKIVVHERDRKGRQNTTQEVEIYFNFVGKYVPPHFGEVNLTPEEQEVIRKKEKLRDRLHRNYLRRKANGKQWEYEERIKSEKQQKIGAKKAALRTEDMAKGVFIPASILPKAEPQKLISTYTDNV